MGITGLYIDTPTTIITENFSNIFNTDLKKHPNIYYIIDDIKFFYDYISNNASYTLNDIQKQDFDYLKQSAKDPPILPISQCACCNKNKWSDNVDYYKEKTYIYITINIYDSQEDRNKRINLLDTFYYYKEIQKNTLFNNLWETLYIELKQYLINYNENLLKELLNIDSSIDLPTEYQNLISFTDT